MLRLIQKFRPAMSFITSKTLRQPLRMSLLLRRRPCHSTHWPQQRRRKHQLPHLVPSPESKVTTRKGTQSTSYGEYLLSVNFHIQNIVYNNVEHMHNLEDPTLSTQGVQNDLPVSSKLMPLAKNNHCS
ncbi:hypothetical protein VPH35_119250 [Triticum aestivum]|uniref:Uncharacterized protein n=1 Tax=Aegilops tauschii subsp. strangulata TaxID=200361 RepID=A0A453Q1Z8_AEGTS